MLLGRYIFIIMIISFSVLVGQSKTLQGSASSNPDTTIFYYGEYVDFDNLNQKIYLTENAKLEYKNVSFSAYQIILDMKKNTVSAIQKDDTVFSKLEPGKIDSILVKGKPTITENKETIEGTYMLYDLDTKQGIVHNARTVMKSAKLEDNTFFHTESMIKLENDDIHGTNAIISSCNLDHPHYYFKADSVIVTKDNWVYAKPISLYFANVPVAWFPYILYKKNKGRNSGFILPSYYYSSSKGNSFKHLGYFWDMSDYTDYTIMADYYDNYGYLINQTFRYKNRYTIKGHINADLTNDYKSMDWRLRGTHHHQISPTMSLDGVADYITKTSLIRDLGETSYDRMQNKLTSSGQFNKRWRNTGDNLSLMSSYTQYVDTAIVKYQFPSLNFNLSGRKPFSDFDAPSMIKKFQIGGNIRSSRSVDIYDDMNIFTDNTNSSIGLTETTSLGDFRVGSSQSFLAKNYKDVHYYEYEVDDEINYQNVDSTFENYGIKTASYLQYNHKLFRHISIRESFNFRHDIAFKYYDEDVEIVNGNMSRSTYGTSISANTSIYGIFQPEIFALKKIRHTISPAISISYNPDFSKDKYGYFVRDSLGTKRDIFAPSMVGGTPSSESATLNYSLKNILDAKIRYGESEISKKLFNVDMSGSYNFAADSNKMSVINTRFYSTLYNGNLFVDNFRLTVNVNASAVTTPYDGDNRTGNYINPNFDFWNKNPFRTESWNANYSVGIPIDFKGIFSKDINIFEESESELDIIPLSNNNFTSMSYDITAKLNFSENYNSDGLYSKNFYMKLSGKIKPTKNWLIEYSSTINFLTPRKLTSTRIKIRREMHCWQGEFEWDMFSKGFKLLINTKSSIFSDIKFDKDTRVRKW
ncbi:MAG: putative LPS assembly protein LptD [Candidatus Delongbacteria bacterium]|jgi:lipopolysaccharide assembly outer membrane protein LptD (OstA)|nr:putative LPS assembly protein LptD [Candidatus Delongbacteria bacterium]